MEDINSFLQDNLGLVYAQLHRFKLADDPDAESMAYEALYKAAITYSDTRGTAFSTYATCVIANAMRMYLRTKGKKRQLQVISYYESTNEEGSAFLLDILSSASTCEEVLLNEEKNQRIAAALQTVLDELVDTRQIAIFEVWQASGYAVSQQAIADKLGVSRAYVNRILGKVRSRLKQELEDVR